MKAELDKRVPLGEIIQKAEAFDFSVPHGCKDCPHPIEPYLGLFPSEVMKEGYGLLLNIPRINLFGTQTAEEYIGNKSRSVQKKLYKMLQTRLILLIKELSIIKALTLFLG